MYIDLHCHSVSSDDSRATVEQYVKWIGVLRGKGNQVDGIVLTEHRKFDYDADYSELAEKYNVLILKGSELDTRYGHMLVYGVNQELTEKFDFSDVAMDGLELAKVAARTGAIVVPAHPGRFGIGLCEYIENGNDFSAIRIVEQLNGGNRSEEQERADELVQRYGFKGTGGSDAHFVSAIGRCLTLFPGTIKTEEDMVAALKAGDFKAVRLDDTAEPFE